MLGLAIFLMLLFEPEILMALLNSSLRWPIVALMVVNVVANGIQISDKIRK
jgi:hypothetical protein